MKVRAARLSDADRELMQRHVDAEATGWSLGHLAAIEAHGVADPEDAQLVAVAMARQRGDVRVTDPEFERGAARARRFFGGDR